LKSGRNTIKIRNSRPVLEAPTILHIREQLAAVIHLTIRWDEIEHIMEPGLHELIAAVSAQGIGPTGPWSNHHLRMRPDVADIEICVPVSMPVVPVGRVEGRNRPARTIVRTVYHGAYQGLGLAWRDFNAWISARRYQAAPDFQECYVIGPDENPDPAAWRTELTRSLIDLGAVAGHA
jgi:effector-binding domain-containing protein